MTLTLSFSTLSKRALFRLSGGVLRFFKAIFRTKHNLGCSISPNIGISHYAAGESKQGEAEGRRGDIITRITSVRSVDFVTVAGRGGAILEAARQVVGASIARARLEQDTARSLVRGFEALGLSERQAIEATARLAETNPGSILKEVRDPAEAEFSARCKRLFGFAGGRL